MISYKTIRFIFLGTLLVVCSGIVLYSWSFWFAVLIPVVFIILMLTLSTNIRWNYFLKAYHSNPGYFQNAIALTFDDGPSEYTLQILDLLDQFHVKAAFFCIGKEIEKHPDIFREIISRGHLIGNHTWSHTRKMGFLSSKQIQEDIRLCDETAAKIGGVNLKIFRPPFGIINPKVKKAIEITGHIVVGWSVRPYDAITSSSEKVLSRINKKIKKGDVVLLHDNKSKTIAILEQLLDNLSKKKIYVVRADKLLEIEIHH